jgi:hypothetical protein
MPDCNHTEKLSGIPPGRCITPKRGIALTRQTRCPNPASANAAVIRAAVAYASAIAAFHGGFRGAVHGGYAVADQAGARVWDKVAAAMKTLSRIPATSAEALDAKARVLEIIREDPANETPMTEAFYLSFANDVRRFVKALHEEKKAA